MCEEAGDISRAERLYTLLEPFADRIACDVQDGDTGSVRRPLGLLAAQLGRRDAAIQQLEAAVEHNDRLGYRPWAAWSRLALGRLLLEDDVRRRPLLAEAVASARDLGMTELTRVAASSI